MLDSVAVCGFPKNPHRRMSVEIRCPANDKEWAAYYDLRYRVLRKPLGKPRGSERHDGDATNIHVALYEDEVLRAIARLDQPKPKKSQVRFVAVDLNVQRKGFGTRLMKACEAIARKRGDDTMVLNARDYAMDWYRYKLNYELTDTKPSYVLFGVLPHFEMHRALYTVRPPANEGEWDLLYDMRYRILLAPLGRPRSGEEKCDGDKSGVHVCVWDEGELRGIARIDQKDAGVSQIQYVAVDESVQRAGYGSVVMRYAESMAKKRGDRKIILHAPETSLDFYERKLGYRVVEKSYMLFSLLQHYLVEKYID